MGLINLDLLHHLYIQAALSKMVVRNVCFNFERAQPFPDELFVAVYKTCTQAEHLHGQLKKLHELCSNYVDGNFETSNQQLDKARGCTNSFDPYDRLISFFSSGTTCDLPTTIEQYKELCTLANNFTRVRKNFNLNFDKYTPDLEYVFEGTDQYGQPTYLSVKGLSEEELHRFTVDSEIRDIEVEYCLDHYNAFYEQAAISIVANGDRRDAERCADELLSLYSYR